MHTPLAFRLLSAVAVAIVLFARTSSAAAATCDRGCLIAHAQQFNSSMLARTVGAIPLAANAKVRENAKEVALRDSRWLLVTRVLSEGVYADPVKGNVVEHVAAETASGAIVYIGTRLRIVDDRIAEVEINFDDRPNVNARNLVPYDPIFNTLVQPEARSTREQLEQIILRYFQGLTDHLPVEADYDVRCDRYHSGNRVTHNARNGIENSGDVGCYESNLGPKPWGPATEVRLAAVDPDRGIVVAYSILHYADGRRMQINEVFKILDGRIRLIDNIGLMGQGLTTSGFTE